VTKGSWSSVAAAASQWPAAPTGAPCSKRRGDLDLSEYGAMKKANAEALRDARARVARSATAAQDRGLRAEAPDLLAQWDELDTDPRRRVVQALCAEVRVMPATVRGRPRYDDARLQVTHQ